MSSENNVGTAQRQQQGLYRAEFEHDNCGIGAVVNIKGKKTRDTVENALKIVENLEHRAGKDAEGKTGDGVGILLQICHRFFKKVCKKEGFDIGEEREYGIAQMFFPSDAEARERARKMFEVIVKKEGLEVIGWREVPVYPEVLGDRARNCMPYILQAFIKKPIRVQAGIEFDRMLYIARREFEHSSEDVYVVSMSSRTIVYKGMFLVDQLRTFFADLQSPDYKSAIALVHSRFSTNTNPSWERAHPNRFIVHNGEINTIRGNADKMSAREENMESPYLKDSISKVIPVVNRNGSDSAMLDNTLEFLVMSGMDLPLAVMITLPEPWSNNDTISQEMKDFYQYYATMMEPWDGPASILFSDGDVMGAVLDRNGLRPSRYYVTSDGYLILSSEVGAIQIPEENIVLKERLHPGKMLLVDTVKGRIINDSELKESYAKKQPYGEWLDSNMIELKDKKIPNQRLEEYTDEQFARLHKAFGYTYEQYRISIFNMALNGTENIAAMGVDTPLAVLSKDSRPLFDYFKQQFAQVTNPPIDAIREEIVTSTSVYVGTSGNLLETKPENCHVLKINNPILTNTDMLKIKNMQEDGHKARVIPILYYKGTKLEKAIDRLFVEVDKAYKAGVNIIVLSDRGVDENSMPIPSLLAVSAVHQYLVKTKKSTSLALILESGEPREVHHFATLLGYGASAVNPYLAHETIHRLIDSHLLNKDYYAAVEDYNHAVISGIIKIASKMGISTIRSYQGSQLFEAVGIAPEVIDKYFTGTVSRVGGIVLDDIEENVENLHRAAFDEPMDEESDSILGRGAGKNAAKNADKNDGRRYTPETIHLLQESTKTKDYKMFKDYTKLVDEQNYGSLRGLLKFNYADAPVPLEEVESAKEIVKRFKTGAMSYGSISQEAHETLTIAMNHIHGKSNTGEGGESDERIDSAGTENDRCSAIKQVASGRFGVTSRYLVSAKEIQIKLAQGAKPGEGGHLPAKKVYPWIAKTRHSTPGVSLISPPPHHDIYSIEDLAQLIYDLKNANKYADISVKLVSEAGVGTVAAGVAKAGAQTILISGYDGGTGAAPKSSIYNAGLPWELGVAEAHQTLIMNGLRNCVRLETDGKLMSGRDVAVAALLGAEEFGFATAPLVTMGCAMKRICNLDTCPMGVATQNPELRKRFAGKPEYVENFMMFVAEELREYMSKLGVRNVNEMVGRTDLLSVSDEVNQPHKGKLDLTALLNNSYENAPNDNSCASNDSGSNSTFSANITFDASKEYNFHLENTLDEKLLIKKCSAAIENGSKVDVDVEVTNTNRTFGTLLGSEITRKTKTGLPDDTITVNCKGAGGQSFGAFIPNGLTIRLSGDSNDYFGKGLSGGKLVVKVPENAGYKAEDNIIVGNVALYGATSGEAYINGIAGERFAVRNSGAIAVVEGVGEHGCEYMTGGRVVVLGKTGKNFAAGMSGGIAYVLDLESDLYKNVNKAMISIEKIVNQQDEQELRSMIEAHVKETGSKLGREVLENFAKYIPYFKKIIPNEYEKIINLSASLEAKGLTGEDANMEAFNILCGKHR